MAWFYNFNFNEDKMYGMPIADLSDAYYHRRKIRINKKDDTIPRTTDPYVEGHITYMVHEFPACVYKRCFWLRERDDEKAEEIRRGYLEARAKMKEAKECHYCDAEENKDIFFNWLPAMFGLEKEDHDYNPDVTVFITDDNELELCVMMSDDYLVKEKKKINFCPFCGRRLRND